MTNYANCASAECVEECIYSLQVCTISKAELNLLFSIYSPSLIYNNWSLGTGTYTKNIDNASYEKIS